MATPAQIRANTENGKKGGPKTEAGKRKSRGNSYKHGLTATVIDPIGAPGEPPGAYQERLDHWFDDMKPQNVFEHVLVSRACRASWKLDRVARFEDAAAVERVERGPEARRRGSDGELEKPDITDREFVRRLACALLIDLEYPVNLHPTLEPHQSPDDPPDDPPSIFCNPGFVIYLLCRKIEGLDWLLAQWGELLPQINAEVEDWSPFDPIVRHARILLGLRDPEMQPPINPREAALNEVRRLQDLHAVLAARPTGPSQRECDLSLFGADPESQLLIRYEAAAERELHRAINTFIKLRQNPQLFVVEEVAEAATATPVPTEPVSAASAPASTGASADPRRSPSPVRNEPNFPERLNPTTTPETGRPGASRDEKPSR